MWSTYHSLQLTLNRRFSKGVTLLGSDVWAKYIDVFSWGKPEETDPGTLSILLPTRDYRKTMWIIAS